ncbi:MAG: AtpZ/AtpI family protein [Deltaproteobacteria bacterium]|nr:AtpZ/AtpI family protein [Deltaproteobacteria bacterium]
MAEENNGGRGFFKGLAMLASMGISMVVSTFIGLLIGIYLDGFFNTKPWLTIIFLFFGIAAGFRNIYLMTKKYGF